MKACRLLLVLAFVLSCAAGLFANSVPDPRVIVKDPDCKETCTPGFVRRGGVEPVDCRRTIACANLHGGSRSSRVLGF